MAIAAGVDFGTPSARVSIVDSEGGLRATALGEHLGAFPNLRVGRRKGFDVQQFRGTQHDQ
jgi:hypothetical protein